VRSYGGAKEYAAAKDRFNQYLASLKKAGKSSEAAQLEKTLSNAKSNASATQKLDSLMQSGSQAFTERRYDDSERDYKQALKIAETLQPVDPRLGTILNHLGQLAAFRKDFTAAQAAFERQLKLTEQLYGPQDATMADPLKWLAMSAMAQRDFPSAQKFLDRALEVNRKVYGETSPGYLDTLRILGTAFLVQESYEKAEPYLVQATEIERKLYDYDPRYGGMSLASLSTLCTMYERWDKPAKLEPCDRQLIVAVERQSGPDTHYLELTLQREAKTLRTLGRPAEAAEVEKRLKSLQPSAANNPN
jgi:tetratricopeptide (TPR) repeat protein